MSDVHGGATIGRARVQAISGEEPWVAHLSALGVHVLRNEAVRDGIELVGLDDAISAGPSGAIAIDYARAFSRHDARAFTVALAHEPSTFDELRRRGVALQLSGRTHGGQIFPLHLVAWLTEGYLAGAYRVGDSILHVSQGAGYWGPPMRLGSRAELTILELSHR